MATDINRADLGAKTLAAAVLSRMRTLNRLVVPGAVGEQVCRVVGGQAGEANRKRLLQAASLLAICCESMAEKETCISTEVVKWQVGIPDRTWKLNFALCVFILWSVLCFVGGWRLRARCCQKRSRDIMIQSLCTYTQRRQTPRFYP